MFKRILVGYDLSEQSRPALALAGGLARACGCALTVAHVLPLPPVLRRWKGSTEPDDLKKYEVLLKRQIASAQGELQRRVARLAVTPALNVQCVVRAGTAPNALVDIADQINVDLIVVGRGRKGVLGPTADRVVRMAGRAVLVAPIGKRSSGAIQFDDSVRRRRNAPRGRIRA